MSSKVSSTANSNYMQIELTSDESNIFTITALRNDGMRYAFWVTRSGIKVAEYNDENKEWKVLWYK